MRWKLTDDASSDGNKLKRRLETGCGWACLVKTRQLDYKIPSFHVLWTWEFCVSNNEFNTFWIWFMRILNLGFWKQIYILVRTNLKSVRKYRKRLPVRFKWVSIKQAQTYWQRVFILWLIMRSNAITGRCFNKNHGNGHDSYCNNLATRRSLNQ